MPLQAIHACSCPAITQRQSPPSPLPRQPALAANECGLSLGARDAEERQHCLKEHSARGGTARRGHERRHRPLPAEPGALRRDSEGVSTRPGRARRVAAPQRPQPRRLRRPRVRSLRRGARRRPARSAAAQAGARRRSRASSRPCARSSARRSDRAACPTWRSRAGAGAGFRTRPGCRRPTRCSPGSRRTGRSGSATGLCFELVYSAGLRAQEAVDLTLADVDFEQELVRVRGKGGKERVVPLGEEAVLPPAPLPRARPPRARARRRGRALPLGSRKTSGHVIAPPPPAESASAPPRLRHAPAGGRRRPADDPGAARPLLALHDPDLQPRRREAAAKGLRPCPPARLTCNSRDPAVEGFLALLAARGRRARSTRTAATWPTWRPPGAPAD